MENNSVVTECGHCFHTSCLLKNVAHNGFGCPYCRSVLAEVPEDEESESEDEDEEEEEDTDSEEEDGNELYSDSSLRSMRLLFQRVENEQVEEEEEEEEEDVPRPSPEVIEQSLIQQGVTMLDMIKCMIAINHEEYESEVDYQTKEDEIFNKMSVIISEYRNPVQEQEVVEPVIEPVVQVQEPVVQVPVRCNNQMQLYLNEIINYNQVIDEQEELTEFYFNFIIKIEQEIDFNSQSKEPTKRNFIQLEEIACE
jgi:hypothetical protein